MRRCLQCLQPIHEPLTAINIYKPPKLICSKCESLWQACRIKDKKQRCSRCLNQCGHSTQQCLDCQFLANRFQLMTQLYCDYQYTGIIKALIHQYKFMKDHYLAQVLAYQLKLPQIKYDYVVPIPSPKVRDDTRTFNPVTTVLAYKGIQYINLLATDLRPKQSKLSKIERAEASNPFYISLDIDLTNKEILLVDDIYTTGLTIHHAGYKLLENKVRKFSVYTFAW